MNTKLLAILCALSVTVDGYHILCIFTAPSRSHNHLGGGIVRALLNAGHEVTWVTPYPPKEATMNLHIIDASITRPIAESIDMTNKKHADSGMAFIRQFCTNISIATNSIPALREILVQGRFDAVATEAFFNDADAGYAAVLQVPWILLSGVVLQPMLEGQVDEVRSVPVLPLLFNDFGVPMSFFERLRNLGMYQLITMGNWWHQTETENLYQSMFSGIASARNVPLPPLDGAINNISILFVNSHPSFAYAQSMPPNVVEIGGYHIEENVPPLPKDLQDLLDSSPQGVIYFSMGSVLKSSALPSSTKQALLKMLGELPYTVLWKFEEELKGLPKNVYIRPWMPQSSILSHKNTKVFITHGGLLSNLEALRFGVPLVGIPFFGDQPANAARAVKAGYAVKVTYEPTTVADELRTALKEILGTDRYSKRMKYVSSLFNKRPTSPAKLISHYVELAIESQGAYHLRSKATLYSWYQRWMLDILALFLISLYAVYSLVKKGLKVIVNKVTGSGRSVKKNKLKKN